MANLGIVIPAYKIVFFEQVLESISNQTNKDFNLYIGIDGSPDDFEPLINTYSDKIPIIYKNFNENLGGKDLVAHWERCIDMTKEEEWLWLFSDDDIMEPTCVESFYDSLSKNANIDLFHFNVSRINEQNEIITNCTPFPKVLSIQDYLTGRLRGIYSSYVLEYIFRKEHFMNHNRFQNFDLGWGSDDATWIKLGKRMGIHTIDSSRVYWRNSRFNISPNKSNILIVYRKLCSQIQFSNWLMEKEKSAEIDIERNILKSLLESWFMNSLRQYAYLFTIGDLASLLKKFFIIIDKPGSHVKKIIFIINDKIYQSSKNMIKKFLSKKQIQLQTYLISAVV